MKKVVGWLLVLAFFFMQSGRARAILICDGEAYVVVAEHNGAHKGMAAVADDNRNGLKYGDMNKLLLSDGSYASVNASFRWTCQVCSDGGFNLVSESGKYLIPAVSSSGKPGLLLDSSQSSVSYWRECENGIEGHSAWYDGNCRLVYVSDGYFTAVPEDDLAESYWQNVKLAPLSVARDSVIMEGGVKVLSGGWSVSKLAAVSWRDVGALDLTRLSLPVEAKDFLSRPETCSALIYVSAGEQGYIPSGWKNVVIVYEDGQARAITPIQLIDKEPLSVPIRFYVGSDSLVYTRRFLGDGYWETLYLPFDGGICPDGYELAAYSGTFENTFISTNRITAYTPLLIRNVRKLHNYVCSFTASAGWVECSAGRSLILNGLQGTLSRLSVNSADDIYLLTSQGKAFHHAVTGSYVEPFHCFFKKNQ